MVMRRPETKEVSFNEVYDGLKINKLKDQKGEPFFTVTCAEGYLSGTFMYFSQAKKALKRIASNITYKANHGKTIRLK